MVHSCCGPHSPLLNSTPTTTTSTPALQLCLLSRRADGNTGRLVLALRDFGSRTIGLRFLVQTLFYPAGKARQRKEGGGEIETWSSDGKCLDRVFFPCSEPGGNSRCRATVCQRSNHMQHWGLLVQISAEQKDDEDPFIFALLSLVFGHFTKLHLWTMNKKKFGT